MVTLIRRCSLVCLWLLLLAPSLHAETRIVAAGGDLQAALSAAQPGDEVVLEAGAKFFGHFQLPTKPFGLPIVVRSSATLPDRRLTPDDAALLPLIQSQTVEAALYGTGIGNWRLDGLWFGPNLFGAGNVIELQDATNIYMDRLVIVGGAEGQKRGILGNGRQITLTRSHIANIWMQGQDSQAFCAWDGGGPYTITDNYLEAASENVMFGGADSSRPENQPADILVEGNLVRKPLEWKGLARVIKNLFELKSATRVVVRRNVFDGNWGNEGQSGSAIVLTPRNQDGTAPWSSVQHVLLEGNIIRNTPMGVNVIGYDNEQFSSQTDDIVIRGNVTELTEPSFALMVSGEIKRLEFSGNTASDGAFLNLDKGGIKPYPETAWREGRFAVESFAYFGNSPLRERSDTANGELAIQQNTVQYSLTGPIDGGVIEPPPPPPPPPPPDPCVVSPLRFIKAVQWPSSATGVQLRWSLNRAAKVTFDPTGARWTVTAIDKGGCSVTVTR